MTNPVVGSAVPDRSDDMTTIMVALFLILLWMAAMEEAKK